MTEVTTTAPATETAAETTTTTAKAPATARKPATRKPAGQVRTGDPREDRAVRDAAASKDAEVLTGVGPDAPAPKPAAPARRAPAKPASAKAPASVKVAYLLDRSGQFRIHKAGCRDIRKEVAEAGNYEKAEPATYASQEEAIRDLWSDQIHESRDGDGEAPLTFLHEHGYVGSVEFLPCASGLRPLAEAKAPARKPAAKATANGSAPAKANGTTLRTAKQMLARRVAEALVKEFAKATPEEKAMVSYWMHSLPTGGADGSGAGGAKRWWPAGLPRPTTADWNGK
jgi:hypothetical protein